VEWGTTAAICENCTENQNDYEKQIQQKKLRYINDTNDVFGIKGMRLDRVIKASRINRIVGVPLSWLRFVAQKQNCWKIHWKKLPW
jgi:hypothetical protein